MVGMTLGREPKALHAMKNSGLWMTSTTLGDELRPLDMKDFRSWAQAFRCYAQLRDVEYMKHSELWVALGYGWHEWLLVVSSGL